MKCLIVHNTYQVPGGEDFVVKAEIELLKSKGHEIYVYERSNAEINHLSPFEKIKYFSSISYSKKTYSDIKVIIKKFKPDVAHFHNIFYLITPSAYFPCREEGVPVVQTLHNFRLLCVNGLLYRTNKVCQDCLNQSRVNGILRRCFQKSFYKSAILTKMIESHWKNNTWAEKVDAYIALSEFSQRKFVLRGLPENKIFIKPNFVITKEIPEKERENFILYVGRLSEEKGVYDLVKAVGNLKDVRLKIIGDGPLRSVMDNYITTKHIDNIEFLGFLSQQECSKYIRKSKMIVVPSLCYENCPKVIIDAFSCGVPVLASGIGSLREMVIDRRNGILFEPNNINDLREKIQLICENASFVSQMGDVAYQDYREKYTEERNYQMLINIYNKILKK